MSQIAAEPGSESLLAAKAVHKGSVSGDTLLSTIQRVHRRLQWIVAGAALCWGLLAALGVVMAAVWLDLTFELSPTYRLALLWLAAGAGLFCLLLLLAWRVLRRSQKESIASAIDEVGQTGGQVHAGYDLATQRANEPPHSTLSHSLAHLAISRAARLAEQVSPAEVVPAKPFGRAVTAVIGSAAVVALAAWFFPGLARAEWLRFTDPYGDHPPYSAVQFAVEPAGAKVRYGDGLDVFVTLSGRPSDSVELVLQKSAARAEDLTGDLLPMFQEPGGRWRATLSNLTADRQFFVRARKARSPKFAIEVLTVPAIEEVRFRMQPPDYARRGAYEGALPQGGLSGLRGTRVEVIIRSNRPLAAADVRFVTSESEQATRWTESEGADGMQLRGEHTIEQSGRLEFTVTDVDGQRSSDVFTAPVILLADERPFVRLLEPRAVSFATPSSQLPISLSAEDDYGVVKLELFRGLNDSRYSPLELPVGEVPPTHAYQVTQLPLHDYGLRPGDEIKLFARTEDNDPAGGKGSESPVALVRIISDEEYERMVRTRDGLNLLLAKYQQAERRMEGVAKELEELREELEKLPADSPLADAMRDKLARAVERMASEANAIRELADSQLPYDLDKQLSKHLEQMADELDKAAAAGKQMTDESELSLRKASKRLEELLQQLRESRNEFQKETAPPLKLLRLIYPLLEDEARFADLYQRQKDLAERLGAYRRSEVADDPGIKARMRDLETEQRELREQLVELLDDIERHSGELGDEPELYDLRQSAYSFAGDVRKSGAIESMREAESSLAQFDGAKGQSAAERAAVILETFLARSQELGGQAGDCLKSGFAPQLGGSMGDTVGQLLADAGFGEGAGFGAGGGGGYSTRRNSLRNVGLYGGASPLGNSVRESQAGELGDSARTFGGQGTSAGEDAGGYALGGESVTSGAADAAVPLEYRSKVGRYFQRIADEVGTQD